ncbi:MAG: tRNA uracil 4-sulfurtransferase ThiI [Oscillospiraceae bacterium]
MMNASPAPQEIFLLKLGEVVLKGQNRQSFEDKLLANVRRRVKNCGSFQCSLRQSTIYVEPQGEDCDMEAAWDACRQVFGIAAVARAVPCEKTVDAIVEAARTYLADAFAVAKSFKVESKRADKMFPMNSIQLSQAVGGDLAELFPHVAVDVHNPDLTVFVEIREKYAYVHTPSVPGAGGLPIGMGGRAVSLLSGGIDSPVSSWMMARRGVELEMVHFVSPPYTSQQAQDKVLELARLLTAWTGRLLVHIVPFTEIQEEIRRNCPEEYFTLIMRRFMMRIAEDIAAHNECKAIVTGENLGQVASQTMEAMACTQAVTNLPVLQPLIGMDKRDIVKIAREIGTFDTSILPYEDCCTVFTPRHPKTRPTVAEVAEAESALDIDALVREAVDGIERIRIDL